MNTALEMGSPPLLAHFVWPHPPSRGQHLRPGGAGSAVFQVEGFSITLMVPR